MNTFIQNGARKSLALLVIALPVQAEDTNHSHTSAYAGQEHRQIKSLSQADIAQLKAGAGWGLAKTAELNGVPGPLHLLEMKEQIDLSPTQTESIEALYQKMKLEAVALGAQLIEQEWALEQRFRENMPDADELKEMLNAIGETSAALRYVHLSAHLSTPDILTEHQMRKYNNLRGYDSGDPCHNIPAGHNANMWRKHNDCE